MDQWVRVEDDRGVRTPELDTVSRRSTSGWASDRPPAVATATRRGRPVEPQPLPADVAAEIRRAADGATAHHREVLVGRMERAVSAYDHHRYQEAARLGVQLTNEVGQVAAVRRLTGFANYRMGRWRAAVRQFEAYLALADDPDVLPALMDCQRALGRHKAVIELWADLRRAAPDADVLAEARIVAAGSLADRGDLREAIEVLASAGAGRSLRNPSERHLRQWYALADLYERAGDVPRARELFTRIALVDPDAYDLPERLAAVGPERRRRPVRTRAGKRTTTAGKRTTSTATTTSTSATGAATPAPGASPDAGEPARPGEDDTPPK